MLFVTPPPPLSVNVPVPSARGGRTARRSRHSERLSRAPEYPPYLTASLCLDAARRMKALGALMTDSAGFATSRVLPSRSCSRSDGAQARATRRPRPVDYRTLGPLRCAATTENTSHVMDKIRVAITGIGNCARGQAGSNPRAW